MNDLKSLLADVNPGDTIDIPVGSFVCNCTIPTGVTLRGAGYHGNGETTLVGHLYGNDFVLIHISCSLGIHQTPMPDMEILKDIQLKVQALYEDMIDSYVPFEEGGKTETW